MLFIYHIVWDYTWHYIDLCHYWNSVAHLWLPEPCFCTKIYKEHLPHSIWKTFICGYIPWQRETFFAFINIDSFSIWENDQRRADWRGFGFFGSILPRKLISYGVLEYWISSSTIWNRCSWVGKDFCIPSPSSETVESSMPDLNHFYSWYMSVIHWLLLQKYISRTLLQSIKMLVNSFFLKSWITLLPGLTVFLWCLEFPAFLAPFEIGYNVEGMSSP